MATSAQASQKPVSLDSLMNKTKSAALLPDDVAHLAQAFLPTNDLDVRSQAYLSLSSFCQNVRAAAFDKTKAPDSGKDTLVRVLGPPVLAKVGDPGEEEFLAGICVLTALFQVDWEAAAVIFTHDGLLDSILDQADISPSPSLPHIAHLLGQAAGHKPCRSVFTSHAVEWLEKSIRRSSSMALRAASGVCLVKLSRNAGTADGAETTVPEKDAEFYELMSDIICTSQDSSCVSDAVEALAYLSSNPELKEKTTADSRFLANLFALVPHGKHTNYDTRPDQSTLTYGVLAIISQLCAYQQHMSDEQLQIEKLKRMAQAGRKGKNIDPSPYDGNPYVTKRIVRLIDAGVLQLLVAAASARLDSVGIRVMVGKCLLSIVETKEHRGKVLQHGSARALIQIIKRGVNDQSSSSTQLDAVYLDTIQALAKLAITAAPIQVFGPSEAAMYDVIRPFSILLQHSSSTLLQRFEALMALTNLASQSPELSSRIAAAEGVVSKVELMMLEDHLLVRRAAVELLCNLLAGADEVFERYGGSKISSNAKSKLEILVALSDVEDVPTKLAASGALATLSMSETVCAMLADLQVEKHKTFTILGQLIAPTADGTEAYPGLVHRGAVCVRNILVAIQDSGKRKELFGEANTYGLTAVVTKVAVNAPPEVMKPLRETLAVLRKQ